LYIGQEAAGTGASAALAPDDYVFTTHRNHGHVIAKGRDPGKVRAEIIGRSGGYLGGRGGTFHVAAPELGIPHTSAIVGGSLPIAAGVAFAVRRRKGQRATLAFFGDGTMEEGVFYETLNLAQLWRLPLVFFMENNSVSAHERAGRGSPTSEHAAKALSGRGARLDDGERPGDRLRSEAPLARRDRRGRSSRDRRGGARRGRPRRALRAREPAAAGGGTRRCRLRCARPPRRER